MIIDLETREIFLEHVRRNRIGKEVSERLKLIAGAADLCAPGGC